MKWLIGERNVDCQEFAAGLTLRVSYRIEVRKMGGGGDYVQPNPFPKLSDALNSSNQAHSTALMGHSKVLRVTTLEGDDSQAQTHSLLDLFWTIYSKFRAVLEGQRVISEVVSRIGMTSAYGSRSQPLNGIPTEDFVKTMQKEVGDAVINGRRGCCYQILTSPCSATIGSSPSP